MTQNSGKTNVKKLRRIYRLEHRELACDLKNHLKLLVRGAILQKWLMVLYLRRNKHESRLKLVQAQI